MKITKKQRQIFEAVGPEWMTITEIAVKTSRNRGSVRDTIEHRAQQEHFGIERTPHASYGLIKFRKRP